MANKIKKHEDGRSTHAKRIPVPIFFYRYQMPAAIAKKLNHLNEHKGFDSRYERMVAFEVSVDSEGTFSARRFIFLGELLMADSPEGLMTEIRKTLKIR